jgi:hypothetical protein
MNHRHSQTINRATAAQTLFAGVVAAGVVALMWPLGAVSAMALVLAPSMLLLGVAGLIDPRILQAALKKPGESVAHLPPWTKVVGCACWAPSAVVLACLLVETTMRWLR